MWSLLLTSYKQAIFQRCSILMETYVFSKQLWSFEQLWSFDLILLAPLQP